MNIHKHALIAVCLIMNGVSPVCKADDYKMGNFSNISNVAKIVFVDNVDWNKSPPDYFSSNMYQCVILSIENPKEVKAVCDLIATDSNWDFGWTSCFCDYLIDVYLLDCNNRALYGLVVLADGYISAGDEYRSLAQLTSINHVESPRRQKSSVERWGLNSALKKALIDIAKQSPALARKLAFYHRKMTVKSEGASSQAGSAGTETGGGQKKEDLSGNK